LENGKTSCPYWESKLPDPPAHSLVTMLTMLCKALQTHMTQSHNINVMLHCGFHTYTNIAQYTLPLKLNLHYTDNFCVKSDLITQFGNQNMMLIVLFYVFFVCKCVLYYCHRVTTQLQLKYISIHISITISINNSAEK